MIKKIGFILCNQFNLWFPSQGSVSQRSRNVRLMSDSPFVILISGSSGVGKTTLTRIIQAVLGEQNTVTVSGDDMHRWERSDPNWKVLTHLDPNANDLELNHSHIKSLSEGVSISRRHYNHDTGVFDAPAITEPKKNILYEGLHALYHEPTTRLATLKIFVDTDETLKTGVS